MASDEAGEPGIAAAPPSGTVTFLFTDIEGSTQRWERDRSAMTAAVRRHDLLMREAIVRHGGHVFKTVGDAFCAAFATAEAAAAAAVAAQSGLSSTDFSAVDGLRVRIGINTGTADERDGDYFGPSVNRVARLLSLAHGGQVLLSEVAARFVRENPPPGATLVGLGEHALKDLERTEYVYQLVAPGLQRVFPKLRAHRSVEGPWLVPSALHTRYFTGRDALLADVRVRLGEVHRVALSGLGGAGKTQSALEFAKRNRDDYPRGVFWVNAETANGLTAGFVGIAEALELAVAGADDQENAVRAALAWLCANDGWLLILDNVDDRAEIARFVPSGLRGDVLITSRESAFHDVGIGRVVAVEDFAAEEAVHFLLARTGSAALDAGESAAASALAMELGNLPLALEQAAAYIAETGTTFVAYLSAFRKRRLALLERARRLLSRDGVAVTWAANFEAVERVSPASAEVLRVAAYLAPDGIPFELFEAGAALLGEHIAAALSDYDELTMAEILRPLARYSLIRYDAAARSFGVHRLVQEIVRDAAGSGSIGIVERTVAALEHVMPAAEFPNWALCERLLPHIAALVPWVDSEAARPAAGSLAGAGGRYLENRGRYGEAETLCLASIALRESAYGHAHPDLADSLNNLAVVYCSQGRNAEAVVVHERALAIREGAFGPDSAAVAGSLNNLANVHLALGKLPLALEMYERALEVWEREFGVEHPTVAIGLNNVAYVNELLAHYAEAQPLHERALEMRQRLLGSDHPHTALSLFNLGTISRLRGEPGEAEVLHLRALDIRERVFGPAHPDVGNSLWGLAAVYSAQGRYFEARSLYERALEIFERSHGPTHSDLLDALDGLASVALKQGEVPEAERLYERALCIREDAFGPEHPGLVHTLVGLADVRREQGRITDAVATLERAFGAAQSIFDSEHPEVVNIRARLAELRA